tara:strand:- start:24046 stop:24423 length:378 start_codon:yes stop_codon:yes gene_type:complete
MELRSIFIVASLLFLISCAQGHCRKQEVSQLPAAESLKSEGSKNTDTIFVFKADGSKQCEKTGGVTLEAMSKELGPIKIHSSKKTHDGMMHLQVCGGLTGMVNVYEIDHMELKKAEENGFRKWKK